MGHFNREKDRSDINAERQQAMAIANGVREPMLVLNPDLETIVANKNFHAVFGLKENDTSGVPVFSLNDGAWDLPELKQLLQEDLPQKKQVQDFEVVYDLNYFGKFKCVINATLLELSGSSLILLTFKPEIYGQNSFSRELDYLKTVRDLLLSAPAMMCSLSGPEHVFELANDKYCHLIGKNDIIGKPIKEVLPEIESQGFIDILDGVYQNEEIYIGHEMPVNIQAEDGVKTAHIDFVYKPLMDEEEKVKGIFVHAVDVTEKVVARKQIEESENELRNLINTVPVIVWITDESGDSTYLNDKWYDYTGQTIEDSEGSGWLLAVHPDDREKAKDHFKKAYTQRASFDLSYRLRTAAGNYRWVIDRGNPKFNKQGNFQGMVGAVIDVHEEVIKGQLIREKEYRTKSIVDEATVATAVYTGLEMKIELANDAMIQLWGKDRSVIGKTLQESLPELEGQPFFDLLEEVYTTGKTYHGKEDRVDLLIDGKMQTGYYNFTYKPLRNEKGEIYGILNMAMDVTEQRLARMKTEESERRYQEIIYSSPALIATFEGEDMEVKIANDSMLEAWGKGKDVIGKPFFSVLPELEGQGFREMLKGVYESGKPFRAYEMPVNLVRNGVEEEMFFNFVYYPQRDINGNITGIVDIATEVTPQAVLNKKIKESESHFRQMADLMPEKVINTDGAGNVIYFNQHWLNYTGLSSEELKKEDWTSKIHPEDKPVYLEQWEKSLRSGENLDLEIRLLSKDGDYRWHLSRAEAVMDHSGKVKIWIATNTDIQRLKEEEKRKEDFLKMVSHELKTPITSIKGYVQLLLSLLKSAREKKLNSLPVRPSLERIDHQITRLTRLISEILDLSRIEENKLELKREVFSINELVAQTVQDISYTSTQHKINVVEECEGVIDADKDRIGQVLINLVNNAIKYSPESREVKVIIHRKEEDRVTVSVLDWGIGIDEENHNQIFKRFFRISEEKEDTYSGFGIGLYLANEIIGRHNGTLEVKSEKGKGSEFSFTLNVAPLNR